MARADRVALISQIEQLRGSRVITYVCSDRPNASANIGDDVIRPMYDHVRTLGRPEKLDLFLYSRGGAVEVPWRIINMLRERTEHLSVLIPYKAHSAATMIALGCDSIVMGEKGELGPIDPAQSLVTQDGGTVIQEEVRVEDVMSFVDFLREKAGLGDQTAIAANISMLAQKLSPPRLGALYRVHSHIRMVARKLLTSHETRLDDQKINIIVDALAEKMFLHGHGIARQEAEELGLPIVRPDVPTETAMWALLEQYEAMMRMGEPVDAEQLLGNNETFSEPITLAVVESESLTTAFTGDLNLKKLRAAPANVQISVAINVGLPDGIPQEAIPQEIIQNMIRAVQQDVPRMVQEQVRQQSPLLRIDGGVRGYWKDITASGE